MYAKTMNNDVTLTGGENPLLAGRYQVVRPLGAGGMGSVYLVEDTQLDNKQFAVKMLPSILVANKRAYRQLKNEALLAMKLVHSNIMQIRAFEENDNNPFLVMDYIEGQTLDDYIADKGTLTEDETMRLLKPVAAALDYAHGEGVVHRDVKPANVMIRKDGRPFVLDFGIAREMQETMTRVTGKFSSGTLLYMSPEQLNGEPPAAAQDVYSFAAMVYECLKGEPPFVRGQIEYQILNNPPPPLPEGIASWLVESIMGGLSKKSDARPSTCCELFRDSERCDKKLVGSGDPLIQQATGAFKAGDYAKAFSIAQQADISNPQIQYIIGWCYENGELFGIRQDYKVALEWYLKAVENGSHAAEFRLGEMYYLGRGVQCDHEMGLQWYRKAAEHGEANAQYKLGTILDDEGEALSWLRMAASQGFPRAQVYMAILYQEGEYGLPRDATESSRLFRAAEMTLRKAAEEGDADAQYELGNFYLGDSDKKDANEALHWYRKAAEHGVPSAQYSLAEMYEDCENIEQDYQEALRWYREAAKRGNDDAKKRLGDMYRIGNGVTQDYKEAIEWYRRAAAQNNDEARIELARIYIKGLGVVRDFKEAAKWYLGVRCKDDGVRYELGLMYEKGNGVKKSLKEAEAYYKQAAINGHVDARFHLGCLYYHGIGDKPDYESAYLWLSRSAKKGHSEAEYYLGLMYYNGEGVEQNLAEAANWFRKAAEHGHAVAQFRFGKCLKNGKGVTRDTAEAVKWYLQAAEQGNADAQYEIGIMFFCGNGVSRDPKKGTDWVIKAARLGNVNAQHCLGDWYANWDDMENITLPRDYVESFKWHKKAAEQGDELSQYRLGEMYYKGLGVAQNYAEALKVFRKFADRRSDAKFYIGMMYRNGEGVEQNYGEAIKWLQKAAQLWSDAAYELGVMYEKGIGIHKNLAEAIDWYRKAAASGQEKATSILEKMKEDAYGTNGATNAVVQHYEDTLVLPGGQKIEMIYCQPGEFLMGSPLIEELRALNEMQHKVEITNGFWLGKYPITQEQWECVMGSNPSHPKGENCPVHYISWYDCQEFIKRLNHIIGCQSRLPTEAEWEYACRAGTRTMFYWGNVFDGSQASCRGLYGSSKRVCGCPTAPTPVDRYAPNAWGFYDMSGNMGEWCEDWYSENKKDATYSLGPSQGASKVFRGGCIVYEAARCRSASRDSLPPDVRDFAIGFRLCCSAE